MAEKPDFDKIFANKATSVHEWEKDNYDTGWGFLGETPPPYELFDALQRENDKKTKYLSERTEEVNTDLTQDINDLQSDLNNKYNELKTGLGGANTALQQHNVDEDAHANLFKRALVTEAKTASNTADWNTLTESRTYKISGATFAADKHQPVGAVGTGELVVLKNGDDTIAQVYYANSAAYDKAGAYHRMCIGGAWTDWVYNITNKGGAVTGDFDINGKLTVKEVQVTDRLLIGEVDPAKPDTSNFLTKDDLQKLQNQIINPVQDIYVDSINGSDENDGTASNPFKTLDKAASEIKTYISSINIHLANDIDGQEYAFTNNLFRSKNNNSLYITNTNYNAGTSKQKRAVIVPTFVKYYTGHMNDYNVGYILTKGFSRINFDSIKIKYPNEAVISDKYSNQLLQGVSTLGFSGVEVNLIDKAVLIAPTSESSFVIDDCKITGLNTSYLAQGNILTTTNVDDDESNWNTWINTKQFVFSNLSNTV